MNCCIFTSLCFNRFFFRIEYYVLVICQRENVYYLFNSPKPWRVSSPSFLLLSSSSAFCLLVLFTPFYLDQTFPKSFPNLSARLSLAWLGLACLSLARLSLAQLLFYFIFEWNYKPQLGEFQSKAFWTCLLGLCIVIVQDDYLGLSF